MRVKNLRALPVLALSLIANIAALRAQEKDAKPADKPAEAAPAAPAKEESSVTDHTIRIGGQTIPLQGHRGHHFVEKRKDEPTALVYYTAYTRSDAKDVSQRPISFVYKRPQVFFRVAAHGVVLAAPVVTVNAGATPPAPYRLAENPQCLLDKTDLVFLDPVGTGFSHAVGKAQDKDFWGVDQDVKSLAQFINTYVSRNTRWNSPKFLIGRKLRHVSFRRAFELSAIA